MKSQQILDQLITYLPQYNDYFTESTDISSLTYSANTVTAVVSSHHGLTTGDTVTITGALEQNPITSLISSNEIATAITQNNNDLTIDFQTTVNITGADQSEYNGDKELLSVIGNKTFTYKISGTPASPATGTIILNEDKAWGYNGAFNVTVINPTTFTYSVSRDLSIQSGNPKVKKNYRIYTGSTIERIVASYTDKTINEYVLFIELGETFASRGRQTQTDASYEKIQGQDYRQQLITNFSLYVFAPTTQTSNAGTVRDSFVDIRKDLIKSLCNWFPDTEFSDSNRRGVTYLGDNIEDYPVAFYIYKYNFELVFEINNSDIFVPFDSRVIEKLEINYLNDFDEVIKNDSKEF